MVGAVAPSPIIAREGGFNSRRMHTYFLEFPTPHAARTKLGGTSEDDGPKDGGARPRKRSPKPGPTPGNAYHFGSNRIPAPGKTRARITLRDLVYWSRPLPKMGDTVGSIRGGGHFFTFSKNSAKNRKNPRGSAKTAAAAGRRARTPSAPMSALIFRQKWGALPKNAPILGDAPPVTLIPTQFPRKVGGAPLTFAKVKRDESVLHDLTHFPRPSFHIVCGR